MRKHDGGRPGIYHHFGVFFCNCEVHTSRTRHTSKPWCVYTMLLRKLTFFRVMILHPLLSDQILRTLILEPHLPRQPDLAIAIQPLSHCLEPLHHGGSHFESVLRTLSIGVLRYCLTALLSSSCGNTAATIQLR